MHYWRGVTVFLATEKQGKDSSKISEAKNFVRPKILVIKIQEFEAAETFLVLNISNLVFS